jgi:hypothetical protein
MGPKAEFVVGQEVEKFTGDYKARGVVRSVFTMLNGAVRYVVEHMAEGGGSFLHIYSGKNLRPLMTGVEIKVPPETFAHPWAPLPEPGAPIVPRRDPWGYEDDGA